MFDLFFIIPATKIQIDIKYMYLKKNSKTHNQLENPIENYTIPT